MSTTTKKKPTDHKPKAAKVKVERLENGARVTLRGITVTIQNEAFDDWELLEALSDLDAENPSSIAVLPKLLKRSLTPGDSKKVMDLLRDPVTHRVPVRAGVQFVLELFQAVNPNG